MLHVTEFLAATMDQTLFLRDNYLRTAFKMIDSDHSGKISWAELRALLGGEEFLDIYSQDQLERAIREVDENGDGEVDFQEFKAMMQSISQ
jgi:calcium-dependent protein kinase